MKALSIRQPWARLIVRGLKDIENRTWRSALRGPILVHASKTFDYAGMDWLHDNMPGVWRDLQATPLYRFEFGGYLGTIDIVDCVEDSPSPWFCGPVGFVLAHPQPFTRMIPARGKLGFFNEPRLRTPTSHWTVPEEYLETTSSTTHTEEEQ